MKTKQQSLKTIQAFQKLVHLAESCKEDAIRQQVLKAQSKLIKKVK